MAMTAVDHARHVALERIRVPANVRDLDASHVDALAGSIALQGMLVPLVVRADGERFELVAGFHRVAAARKLDLTEVPVVVRDAANEAADRAVENIASCRRRHDVIYAGHVVMPRSQSKCPTVRCEPAGEVGIRPRTDPGSQSAADDLAEVGAAARRRKRARHRHPRRSRFVSMKDGLGCQRGRGVLVSGSSLVLWVASWALISLLPPRRGGPGDIGGRPRGRMSEEGRQAAKQTGRLPERVGEKGSLLVSICQIASVSFLAKLDLGDLAPRCLARRRLLRW